MISQVLSFLSGPSKSKTVIVNTLLVVAGVLDYLTGHQVIMQSPDAVAAMVSVIGVINVGLRFLTNKPLSEKKSLMD